MRWAVVRQDTHGTRFEMAVFDHRKDAEAMVAEYEAGYPHHQTYFVIKRPTDPAGQADPTHPS